jgi:hypothetical protein
VCSCRGGYSRQQCHGKFRPVPATVGHGDGTGEGDRPDSMPWFDAIAVAVAFIAMAALIVVLMRGER